jgi:hypothetical protein
MAFPQVIMEVLINFLKPTLDSVFRGPLKCVGSFPRVLLNLIPFRRVVRRGFISHLLTRLRGFHF